MVARYELTPRTIVRDARHHSKDGGGLEAASLVTTAARVAARGLCSAPTMTIADPPTTVGKLSRSGRAGVALGGGLEGGGSAGAGGESAPLAAGGGSFLAGSETGVGSGVLGSGAEAEIRTTVFCVLSCWIWVEP
jgi:hypothetical protein